jgi:hypothetical protein
VGKLLPAPRAQACSHRRQRRALGTREPRGTVAKPRDLDLGIARRIGGAHELPQTASLFPGDAFV